MGWDGVKRASKSIFSSKRKGSKNSPVCEEKKHSGYFSGTSGTTTPTTSALDTSLGQMFDKLRDDSRDEKDTMGVESTMAYLENLGVDLENAEMLVVAELLQSPSIGAITKKGYIDGWKTTGSATRQAHAAHVKSLVNTLATDPAYFKKVYRYTFVASKEENQKALALDTAKVYWSVLFSPPGWQWKTKSHDWLELWSSFLDEKWTRSVNRDMWNMILEFATKTMSDETLSFWNEDGAWPSVIDDFVAWCREKGVGKADSALMDVDA
ncbi:Defective in cullin neddylation protein 1 [Colletotrichum aenigma]|uniref:Defective in cullin neddylation protein 1 n=1 Tax=Colletotrichum aenigma TaxID=1215731 RepID=UPI0018727352|nr:Defective in cullin neddylation protein 1 [Colletotrichum aenigma]KAF5528397.1 Defective in cullin neddylation protein 1 [Colletotrichum aenigma]